MTADQTDTSPFADLGNPMDLLPPTCPIHRNLFMLGSGIPGIPPHCPRCVINKTMDAEQQAQPDHTQGEHRT